MCDPVGVEYLVELTIKPLAQGSQLNRIPMKTLILLFCTAISFAQDVVVHDFPVISHPEMMPQPAVSGAVIRTSDVPYLGELKTDIYSPAGQTGRPAILVIHGGGWASGDKAQLASLADTLARLGYVCFAVSYTLSDRGKYPAAVRDLQKALEWISQHGERYGANPRRIAILGFSAGGHLAALLGTTYHKDLYREGKTRKVSVAAVIDIDGILAFIHPESGEGDDSRRPSAATRWFGYPKTFSTLGWEEASPLTHVSAKTPPVLFINSSVARMHAGRDDFREILDRHAIYSEAHELLNAPHDFCLRRPWFSLTVQLSHRFLENVFP